MVPFIFILLRNILLHFFHAALTPGVQKVEMAETAGLGQTHFGWTKHIVQCTYCTVHQPHISLMTDHFIGPEHTEENKKK